MNRSLGKLALVLYNKLLRRLVKNNHARDRKSIFHRGKTNPKHQLKDKTEAKIIKLWTPRKRNSKIPKGQTEIVKSRTDKTMANKMKRKTNIEHTTLH